MTSMRNDLLWVSKRVLELSERIGGDEVAIAEMARASHEGESFSSDHHVKLFFHDLRFATRWARCGWPQIVTGHKFAASLMATSVAPDAIRDIAFPWPAFAVVIPQGMMKIATANGRDWEPDSVWLYPSDDGGHTLAIRSDDASIIVRTVSNANDLAAAITEMDYDRLDGSTEADARTIASVEARNARTLNLIWRLVLGVCIELDQPKHRIVISNGPPAAKAKRGRSSEPKSWTFNLTRDVKVDCREWVTSYLSGREGTRASVQSLVRGHHKRQAYGPENSLRKWIHVEPYWRGPEDAPIAVRSHLVDSPRT